MYSRKTTVLNKTGLHARPASTFVQAAGKYGSKITIENLKSGKQVNAKSIVMILTLAAGPGTDVRISAEGADETAAVDDLVALIDSGFGEL